MDIFEIFLWELILIIIVFVAALVHVVIVEDGVVVLSVVCRS